MPPTGNGSEGPGIVMLGEQESRTNEATGSAADQGKEVAVRGQSCPEIGALPG